MHKTYISFKNYLTFCKYECVLSYEKSTNVVMSSYVKYLTDRVKDVPSGHQRNFRLDLIRYNYRHTDTAGSFEGQQFRKKESSSRKQNQQRCQSNHVKVKG